MRALSLAAALSCLCACQIDKPVDCTMEARASVQVSVVDQNGLALVPSSAEFRFNGGDPQPVECMSGEAACSEFVVGWEQAGTFSVTASYEGEVEGDPCCWYNDNQTVEVEVGMTEDECHVETQQITITLDTSSMLCADVGADSCG